MRFTRIPQTDCLLESSLPYQTINLSQVNQRGQPLVLEA